MSLNDGLVPVKPPQQMMSAFSMKNSLRMLTQTPKTDLNTPIKEVEGDQTTPQEVDTQIVEEISSKSSETKKEKSIENSRKLPPNAFFKSKLTKKLVQPLNKSLNNVNLIKEMDIERSKLDSLENNEDEDEESLGFESISSEPEMEENNSNSPENKPKIDKSVIKLESSKLENSQDQDSFISELDDSFVFE